MRDQPDNGDGALDAARADGGTSDTPNQNRARATSRAAPVANAGRGQEKRVSGETLGHGRNSKSLTELERQAKDLWASYGKALDGVKRARRPALTWATYRLLEPMLADAAMPVPAGEKDE